MFLDSAKNIKEIHVNAPGALNVIKQTLVGPDQGWAGWVMRLFTVAPEGHTPRHSHSWPHINYIVSGEGIMYLDGQEHPVEPGYTAYIPGGTEHQFINRGHQDFVLICIVPEEGDV
ncbi:cupin domain-containing protein [Desulfoscipio gibsoniae]|uniref:Cupin domain-containing protein n=1 Tax=Desulfoscipio gibsoniae DSM 7213 TaxID=767817 RepID=R4KGU7_9FIRM|nr:cupin domain-containing protein [Desulfoscipio gibsoniae]AGL02423.1 cupin domain-containing protein [Desulfoscipio gibsoniae DSM 7213]